MKTYLTKDEKNMNKFNMGMETFWREKIITSLSSYCVIDADNICPAGPPSEDS